MSVESTSSTPSSPVAEPRGLHPIWIGAIALAMLSIAAALLVTYSLFHFAWQERMGAWYIVLSSAFAIGTVIPLRLWTTSAHKA